MSQFIGITDYDASIHREILDALVREDETLVEVCEDRAIAQMRGYLSRRYDCDALFSATGGARNQLVLMMAIDISIYHIFCIHNPMKLSQVRKDRYDRAMEWLRQVAAGDISVDGAPPLPDGELAEKSSFVIKSNHKRVTHY
jgi:phage gp36-like protein